MKLLGLDFQIFKNIGSDLTIFVFLNVHSKLCTRSQFEFPSFVFYCGAFSMVVCIASPYFSFMDSWLSLGLTGLRPITNIVLLSLWQLYLTLPLIYEPLFSQLKCAFLQIEVSQKVFLFIFYIYYAPYCA